MSVRRNSNFWRFHGVPASLISYLILQSKDMSGTFTSCHFVPPKKKHLECAITTLSCCKKGMWHIPLTPLKEYNYIFFFDQGSYSRIIHYNTARLSSQNNHSKSNSIKVQKQYAYVVICFPYTGLFPFYFRNDCNFCSNHVQYYSNESNS